jgi:hypothetical protein
MGIYRRIYADILAIICGYIVHYMRINWPLHAALGVLLRVFWGSFGAFVGAYWAHGLSPLGAFRGAPSCGVIVVVAVAPIFVGVEFLIVVVLLLLLVWCYVVVLGVVRLVLLLLMLLLLLWLCCVCLFGILCCCCLWYC